MNKEYIKVKYSNDYDVNMENLEIWNAHIGTNRRDILEEIININDKPYKEIFTSEALQPFYDECIFTEYDKTLFNNFLSISDSTLDRLLYTYQPKLMELIASANGYIYDIFHAGDYPVYCLYPKDADIECLRDLYFNENIYDIIFYNEKMEQVDSTWQHIPNLDEEELTSIFYEYRNNSEIGGVIANDITNYIKFDKLKLVKPIPVKYEFKEL